MHKIKEFDDKLTDDDKKELDEILSKLKKAKDEKDLDNIKELKEELETKWHGISSKLYEQSESPEGEKSDETVEDAKFEEVD